MPAGATRGATRCPASGVHLLEPAGRAGQRPGSPAGLIPRCVARPRISPAACRRLVNMTEAQLHLVNTTLVIPTDEFLYLQYWVTIFTSPNSVTSQLASWQKLVQRLDVSWAARARARGGGRQLQAAPTLALSGAVIASAASACAWAWARAASVCSALCMCRLAPRRSCTRCKRAGALEGGRVRAYVA